MVASGEGGYRLGVDVGGTFTDVCVITPTGDLVHAKVASTPQDQSVGVRNGIAKVRKVLELEHGFDRKFAYVHHGTTIATNAVLEGKGAVTGLIVTEGHKDILSLRRSQIPGGLGAWIGYKAPEPVVPLERTVVCPERISITGEVFKLLDEEAFRKNLADLKRQKPEAISVSLLNSFVNDAHEKQVCDILAHEFGPNVEIVRSSDVLPLPGEYERTETTTTNAVVKPIVKRYLHNLENLLIDDTDTLRILKSDGDLTSVDLAGQTPVNILMSGPAGGVKGVANVVAKNTPYKNLITLDMGGTSTDCALVPDSVPSVRRETVVGSLTVKCPSVDVHTVGTGGGSIAVYNEVTKSLRVGPESAGASPGPAAYGKGGTEPTVTDANLVLGYLPSKLLGGDFQLHVDAAVAAVDKIAKCMDLRTVEAAEGIVNLANEAMYGALRNVSVEQGYDPRDFALVAFGGAGPLAANAIGKLLGAWPVIIPPSPGMLCAYGDATTKLSHEMSTSYIEVLSKITSEGFQAELKPLREGCEEAMKRSLGQSSKVSLKITYEADLRYHGQAITLTIYLNEPEAKSKTTKLHEVIREKFNEVHTQQFSFSLASHEVEIMRLRAKVIDDSPEVDINTIEKADSKEPPTSAIIDKRKITLEGKEMEATFWDRAVLNKQGYNIPGPAIITEMDSNTLILPGHHGEIDNMGNILIWKTEDSEPRFKSSKYSPESAEIAVAEDPLISTLISSSLSSIRREMDTLMLRCAMSPAIREQQDEFNVISNPEGQMLVGQFGSFVPSFLDMWKGTIEEGDVFVTNDVYQVKGAVSHLNDIIILLPIWFEGEIVGWAAQFGHLTDVQGSVPGSMSINASTIFDDGMQIPVVKLYAKGVYNETLVEVLCRNSRLPEWYASDLTALTAACRTAAVRIQELCSRYEVEVYHAACNDLLKRNRAAISYLIENKVGLEKCTFTDFIDDDGHGVGPWAVKCTMFKENGKLIFDWDGTSPQSGNSSINFYLSETMFKMFVGYYLLAVYDPFYIVNDGSHDLLEIRVPEGSILKPVRPAAVSCRTHLLGRIMDVMQALFGQRDTAFRAAAGFSDSPHLFYSGFKPTGEQYILYQIGFGGIPARPAGDGPDCHCLFPAIKSIPTETLELYFPLLIISNASLPDSGGAGFFRGGNAQRTLYRFLCKGEISLHDDRWFTKPWGVNGGKPGARSRKIMHRAPKNGKGEGVKEVLPSKADHIRVGPGDTLEWITWGGGGLGDPLTRPAEKVALEVHRRLVTFEGAKSNYGVIVNPEDFSVNIRETEELRAKLAEEMEAAAKGVTENDRLEGYDRGGSLEELIRKCKEETGLQAPRPQWEGEAYGPHVALPYVKGWYERMREVGYGGWDV